MLKLALLVLRFYSNFASNLHLILDLIRKKTETGVMKDELNNELAAARNFLCAAWKKHREQKNLEPLEEQIVAMIEQHPEYQEFFDNPDDQKVTNPSDLYSNPFLHISLHLSILDQLTINQPEGIKEIYQQLILKNKGSHAAEHIMMECLQEMMNTAWTKNEDPSPEQFLKLLKKYV